MTMEPFEPITWATLILICTSIFTVVWSMDALTHRQLIKQDIGDPELQTHRNILVGSMIMEVSLLTMFWYPLLSLPFFLSGFFVRTVHEVIDENRFHVDRCSPRENYIHLTMWLSLLSKTILQFIWAFFYGYEGLENLHPLFFVWAILLVVGMAFTSFYEWGRKSTVTR